MSLKIIYIQKIISKFYNIHIQIQKYILIILDFIVAPEHDRLEGENVIKSKGAIHYITDEEIQGRKALTK